MNTGSVIKIVFVVFALALAMLLGQWAVTDPVLAGIVLAITIGISTFIVLQKNVWMLIPVFSVVSISFPWIPGNFAPVELASMYVLGCLLPLLVTRQVTLNVQFTAVEWASVAVLLMLLQVFLRNPVGVRMLNSDYVGGRPYFILILVVAAAIVLASTKTNHRQIQKLFKWCIIGHIATIGIQAIAIMSAKLASYTGALFGITGGHSYMGQSNSNTVVDSSRATRNEAAVTIATAGSQSLVAFRNPLKAMTQPVWLIILFTVLLGAGMSGFRNVIGSTGLTLLLGIYYWGKMRAVTLALFIAFVGYFLINVVNLATPLPANVQRSLSFLPGTWNQDQLDDAESSTEWRVEMWKEALSNERYIQNRFLGDGLGIRKDDMAYMTELSLARVMTNEMSQERAMLSGDYHSGPVTTIKAIGFIGLIVFIVALLVLSIRAHRLILSVRGRPEFKEIIFFCIPMVWAPIFFIFIFGSFKGDIIIFFLNAGLLRLLENNTQSRIESQTAS